MTVCINQCSLTSSSFPSEACSSSASRRSWSITSFATCQLSGLLIYSIVLEVFWSLAGSKHMLSLVIQFNLVESLTRRGRRRYRVSPLSPPNADIRFKRLEMRRFASMRWIFMVQDSITQPRICVAENLTQRSRQAKTIPEEYLLGTIVPPNQNSALCQHYLLCIFSIRAEGLWHPYYLVLELCQPASRNAQSSYAPKFTHFKIPFSDASNAVKTTE